MINFSHSVTGDTIGYELADDEEEAARALLEMAQRIDLSELIKQLGELTAYEGKERIGRLLALGQTIVSAAERKIGNEGRRRAARPD